MPPAADRPRHPPRGGLLALLTALVLLAHLWLADGVLPDQLGAGAADHRPRRIEVAFVRQMTPSAPPALAPRAVAPRRRAPVAAAAAPAASSAQREAAIDAERVASAPASPLDPPAEPTPEPVAPLPLASSGSPDPALAPGAGRPSAAEATANGASVASAPASAAAPAFEWPPSTRITYRLTGNYRGPVDGQARVEWLRSGSRYQVFMDLGIGPSFAPLMSRRVSSEGEITDQGLAPRRYDEETRVVLRDPRRVAIALDADRIRLPRGDRPRPAGVQDSASQFVQMTWLFTTRPDLLQPGRSIEFPLALPLAREVEVWVYDVLGSETLDTPVGPVEAIHVKPRREPRPGIDLTVEMWVAPTLQYLPVRLLIHQDQDTWIDLAIERLPEQALPQGRPR